MDEDIEGHDEHRGRGDSPPRAVRLFAIVSLTLVLASVAIVPRGATEIAVDASITAILAWAVWRGSKLGWSVALILAVLELGLALASIWPPDALARVALLGAIDGFAALVFLGAPSTREWIFPAKDGAPSER